MTEEFGASTVKKILIMQFSVIFIVTTVLFLIEQNYTISSLVGGLIAFLPNLYFAYRLSLAKGGDAKQIVRSFYSGETRKILSTSMLFALAFQVPQIQLFPLMTCFVAVLSVFWLALILFAQDFEIKSVRKDG